MLKPQPIATDIPQDSYSVVDIPTIRSTIFSDIKNTFNELKPLEYGDYVLKIENVDYEGPEEYTLDDELKATLKGKTLARRLKGDIILFNKKTNQEMRKRTTLLNVPYMTSNGTFIFNGNPYALVNQQRLRPGIYIRDKVTGDLEAFVNTTAGLTHKYFLDPESGIFTLEYKQGSYRLYPILKALGVSDEEMIRYWGKDIYEKNVSNAKTADVLRLTGASNIGEATQKLRELFSNMSLDPSVMGNVLGKSYDRVTPEVILAATKKMLDVYNGRAEKDNRDELYYQYFVGPNYILSERIKRFHPTLRKYILRAVRKGSLDPIPASVYDDAINSLLLGSGLIELLDEINPGEMLDRMQRVVKTGEGGIQNPSAITMDARAVQTSQFGFIDPVVTGALQKVGTDNRLAWMTRISKNGSVYNLFKDVKTGKYVWRSPHDLVNAVIAFPGELENNNEFVRVIKNGKLDFAKRDEVDYVLPYFQQTFSIISNLVPLQANTFPQRILMGAKMHLQSVPLINREAPLVQTENPLDKSSFHKAYGNYFGAKFSPVDGTIQRVTDKTIEIKGNDNKLYKIELYKDFPYNRKTFISNFPQVKPGDEVRKGQLLAPSNYTDDTGTIANGLNAYTAYIPFKGYSYEDAFVISESLAKKLTSEHMYQEELELGEHILTGKDTFKSVFPGKYPEEFYKKYDDDGVIKPGQKLQKGDPIILAASKAQYILGRKRIFTDASVTWDYEDPGEVVYVDKDKNRFYVAVKSYAPVKVGDKLSGRYGDKGVVGAIIPDEQMPRDSQGRPFELLINPYSIISRTNLSQVLETVLSKIARERGEPYVLPPYLDNAWEFANSELQKYGVNPNDVVVDPQTGVSTPPVLTGYRYIMKLHHMAESKLQERELAEYTAEELPAKGGKEGSKRIGMLELLGILGHGAHQVIREAKLVRGQKYDEYWSKFMRGQDPVPDKRPLVLDKFFNQLRAAGINVLEKPDRIHVYALTDDDIKQLTGARELKSAETVKIKNDEIKPIPGGLFDEGLTGGLDGRYWSFIKLSEPMPSPVMEDVIRSLLNLTKVQYENIIAGKDTAPNATYPGLPGLYEVLKNYNVDKELDATLKYLQTDRGKLDTDALKKAKYLLAIKKYNQHPSQWFWTRLPVIPPIFRPVSVTDRYLMVADANALYQDAFEANEILNEQKKFMDDVGDARLGLYRAIKAVTGLGDPIQAKHKQQNLKGFIAQIASERGKFNEVLRKLLTFTTDIVGRAVITPKPEFDLDHVGLPITMAWKLYKPYIIRRLYKQGMPLIDAIRAYNNLKPEARDALLKEMQERPVIINRAPVLHRWGVMAFWPVITASNVVEFNPFVTAGMAADYDGDTIQIHVPSSKEAVAEAINKMLPSKNLFSTANSRLMYPIGKEFLGGLWAATAQKSSRPPKRFKTKEDAIRAYLRGQINYDDKVIIDYE